MAKRGRKSSLSADVRRMIVAKAKAGMAQKAIAAELDAKGIAPGIAQQTISTILRQADADAGATSRRTKVDRRSAAPKLPRSKPGPDPADVDSSDLPRGESVQVELRRLRARLAQTERMADEAAVVGNLPGFATMAKLQAELTDRIARLTPPPLPKPEDDPNKVRALDILRAILGCAA